uniref:Uncharacterized protein n=1 Tax=virus sp. ctLl75 TaxID=2828249 RepID=A0A8S5RBF2_9VIRU|nr:MAG TPA: hypothetical protein [virus sp. ctLl75]
MKSELQSVLSSLLMRQKSEAERERLSVLRIPDKE